MITNDDLQRQTSMLGLLEKLLDVLHDIGGSYYAKRMLEFGRKTAVIRDKLEKKVLTEEQIEEYALSTWECAVMRLNELKREPKF